MERVVLEDAAHVRAAIREAAAALRRGGLVVYPTETFYALGARALDTAAVARLARAKGRTDGKPIPLLAPDRAAVEEVAELRGAAALLADQFWPGPLTLVLPARAALPAQITAGTGTVGIRVTASDIARALAREAGGPLVSTSANLSGEPPPVRPEAISPEIRSQADHVLDAGPTPGGPPSTVVAIEPGGGVRLIRPGAIPLDALERALRMAGR